MSTPSSPRLILHTYFRSSSSARLRMALKLKGITSVKEEYVDLVAKQQYGAEHKALTARMSVPVLQDTQAGQDFPIAQSVAALEYLEEVFPGPEYPPLLPPTTEPLQRAKVRTLVNLIVTDIQPLVQLRVLAKLTEIAGVAAKDAWEKEFTAKGFVAVEELLKKTAGTYSVGDSVTLSDCCLVPAIWLAERMELELEPYPVMRRVYENLNKVEAVKESHWSVQPDTPAQLRRSAN